MKHGRHGAMVTSRECREQADRFAALSLEGGISVRRATILMAIADSWTRLAVQLDRFDALEEGTKPDATRKKKSDRAHLRRGLSIKSRASAPSLPGCAAVERVA